MDYNNEIYNLLRYFKKLRPESTFYRPMQYVLRNLRSIGLISIYELADASFVSPASISRMCRDLGYKNYQEFKINVYSAYRHAAKTEQPNGVFRVPREDADSPDAAMVLNYLDQCRASLDFSESFVRSEAFQKHLDMMRNADNIFVFSTTHQDVIPLQNKLILSGKYLALYHGSVQEVISRSQTDMETSENICCLFFLHTGEEYEEFKPFLLALREKGIASIMLKPRSIQDEEEYPLLDSSISFPDVGSLSDETFFSSYIACLTLAL